MLRRHRSLLLFVRWRHRGHRTLAFFLDLSVLDGVVAQSVGDLVVAFLPVELFEERLVLAGVFASLDPLEKAEGSLEVVEELAGYRRQSFPPLELRRARHVPVNVGADQFSKLLVSGVDVTFLLPSAEDIEGTQLGDGDQVVFPRIVTRRHCSRCGDLVSLLRVFHLFQTSGG